MEKAKIIIVEDDIMNLDIICCELFDFYELHPISDDQFSLSDFEQIMPNLIIFDTEMNNVDIFSLYNQQQMHPLLKTIPIMFSISTDNLIDQEKLSILGIENYITKPYNMQNVQNKIDKILSTNNL